MMVMIIKLWPNNIIDFAITFYFQRAYGAASVDDGEIYSSYSVISGYFFGVIFAADMNRNEYDITPKLAGFEEVNYYP